MSIPTQNPEAHAELAALGVAMKAILESEAFKTGVLLTRAQIYEDWCSTTSPRKLAKLKAEQQALERLLQAFENIHANGMIAQEAIRRENAALGDVEADDTELA